MKHPIILLAFLLLSNFSFAQVYPAEDTTVYNCLDYDQSTDVHAGLVNGSTRSGAVDFEFLVIDLPSNGWTLLSLCDNLSCYNNPNVGMAFTSASFNPGDTMDLKATYGLTATADDGQGIAIIRAILDNDTTEVVIKAITCGPQSVETLDKTTFDISYYSGNLKLIMGSQMDATMYRVYDIFGQVLAHGNIQDKVQDISFDRAPSVYIMQVLDKNGRQLDVKKFANY